MKTSQVCAETESLSLTLQQNPGDCTVYVQSNLLNVHHSGVMSVVEYTLNKATQITTPGTITKDMKHQRYIWKNFLAKGDSSHFLYMPRSYNAPDTGSQRRRVATLVQRHIILMQVEICYAYKMSCISWTVCERRLANYRCVGYEEVCISCCEEHGRFHGSSRPQGLLSVVVENRRV